MGSECREEETPGTLSRPYLPTLTHNIQENNYFCGFPLPNLTGSCVERSTETSTRQEQPTLN